MAIKLAYLTSRRWQKGLKTMAVTTIADLLRAGLIKSNPPWWVSRVIPVGHPEYNQADPTKRYSIELNGGCPSTVLQAGDNLWMVGVARNGNFTMKAGDTEQGGTEGAVELMIQAVIARGLQFRSEKIHENGIHCSLWCVPLDPVAEKAFLDAQKVVAPVAPIAPVPVVAPVVAPVQETMPV